MVHHLYFIQIVSGVPHILRRCVPLLHRLMRQLALILLLSALPPGVLVVAEDHGRLFPEQTARSLQIVPVDKIIAWRSFCTD